MARWMVALVAAALVLAHVGCAQGQQVSYDYLNAVLNSLSIEIDTSGIEDFSIDADGRNVDVSIGSPAVCQDLGLGNITVETSGAPYPIVNINGTDYEQNDFALTLQDLTFECSVPVTLSTGGDGTVTLTSLPQDGSKIVFAHEVFSEDFSLFPPAFAREKQLNCSEKVVLDGATFSANGFRVFFFFNIDGQVEDGLNGDGKAESLAPISGAFCDQVAGLSTTLNDLFVANPFTNTSVYGVEVNKTLGESALDAERALAASLPAGVGLIDLGDNPLVNMLLPLTNGSLVLSPDNELLDTAFGFFNISLADNSTNPVLAILDSFLGTELAATGGQFQELDLLAVLGDVAPNLTQDLRFDFNLTEMLTDATTGNQSFPATGMVAVELLGLTLSADVGSGPEEYAFDLIGDQTLAIPEIALGDLAFRATLRLDVDVAAELFGEEASFLIAEEFQVSLDWARFVAQAAVVLPIDGNQIPQLQLGGLLRALLECALSLFHVSPTVSAAFVNADSIDLLVSGLQDGLLKVLGDLVNALMPMYQGVLPGTLQSIVEGQLVNQQLIQVPECPTTELNSTTSQPFSFADDPFFSSLNAVASLDAVTSALDAFGGAAGLAADFGLGGDGGAIALVSEPVDLATLEIPQAQGQGPLVLDLALESVALTGLLSQELAELDLFNVSRVDSVYYPQSIFNALALESRGEPVALTLVLAVQVSQNGVLQSSNAVEASLSLRGLQLLLEVFAAFSIYDVQATTLELALNLDCWVAKLDPYGGVKTLLLNLVDLGLAFGCTQCDNVVLAEFLAKFSTPENTAFLVDFAEAAITNVSSAVTDAFGEGMWNATVADAGARCAGNATGSLLDSFSISFDDIFSLFGGGNGTGVTAELPQSEQDLTRSFVFVAMFFSVLGLAGLCTFGCRVGPRRGGARRMRHSPAGPQDNGGGGDDDEKKGKQRPRSGEIGVASFNPLGATPASPSGTHALETPSLFRHPSVPRVVRFGVPVVLLVNFSMFLLGHIDVVLKTDLVGSAFGIPFTLDDFAALSVIETIKTLVEGGAIFLALLLGGFSVVWPYIKLLCVSVCWLVPARTMGFSRRGSILTILDQLGKWSLVELYFIAFVNVVLKLSVQAPEDSSLLPAGAYDISLQIELLFNLYTFTVALLLSLFVSNIAMAYHERIEHQVLQLERQAAGVDAGDLRKLGLRDCLFQHGEYGVSLSSFGAAAVFFAVLSSAGVLAYACFLPVLEINIFGLARPLMELSGEETTILVDLYNFMIDTFAVADAGQIFFGAVLVLTVLVVPVLQMLTLLVIPLKRFSLMGAIRFLEFNKVLSAWCATEVFVLAVAVTTLELKTVTKFLVEEECAALNPVIMNFIYPSGLLDFTARDVEASCFGMEASIQLGAYVFFAGLVLSNFCHLFVIKLFQAYIDSRTMPASAGDSCPPGCTVRVLAALQLLKIRNAKEGPLAAVVAVAV